MEKSTVTKTTLPVLNMSCASCAMSVESMLKAQTGVVNATVNFANATTFVEYIPQKNSLSQFQDALRSIGFDLVIEEDIRIAEEIAEQKNEENYESLKKRTTWALLLALPVMLIGMFWMTMPYANFIMWAFTTPVVFWLGKDFFKSAFKQARHRKTNMDTLVAVSTGVSYIFSVFNTFFPQYWHRRGCILTSISRQRRLSLLLFFLENYWKKKPKEAPQRLLKNSWECNPNPFLW